MKQSAFKRIGATCYNVNAKGEVRGRHNLAKIYPDKTGSVNFEGHEYKVSEVVAELFPKA